jgi:hypothetical protein
LRDHFVEAFDLLVDFIARETILSAAVINHSATPLTGISLRNNGELLGRPIVEKLPAETAHPILKTAIGLIAESQRQW